MGAVDTLDAVVEVNVGLRRATWRGERRRRTPARTATRTARTASILLSVVFVLERNRKGGGKGLFLLFFVIIFEGGGYQLKQ